MKHVLPAALIAAAVLAHSARAQSANASPSSRRAATRRSTPRPPPSCCASRSARAVTLRVNGAAISPTLIGRTETDEGAQTVTQTWYGVVFKEGT